MILLQKWQSVWVHIYMKSKLRECLRDDIVITEHVKEV